MRLHIELEADARTKRGFHMVCWFRLEPDSGQMIYAGRGGKPEYSSLRQLIESNQQQLGQLRIGRGLACPHQLLRTLAFRERMLHAELSVLCSQVLKLSQAGMLSSRDLKRFFPYFFVCRVSHRRHGNSNLTHRLHVVPLVDGTDSEQPVRIVSFRRGRSVARSVLGFLGWFAQVRSAPPHKVLEPQPYRRARAPSPNGVHFTAYDGGSCCCWSPWEHRISAADEQKHGADPAI